MPSRVRRVALHVARHAKDHFIPHEGNQHHPHVLKHRVLFGYSLILVLLKVLTIAGSIALPSWTIQASAITPENILVLTNGARQNLGLSALNVSDKLAIAARAKAEDMAVNQYFAHTSPAGITPWTWIKNTGYRYRVSAENLAVHFHESEDVQSGWMASPSHRANIVDPRFTETGIGIALGEYEGTPTTFVVQYFALPKSATIEVPTTTVAAAPTPTPTSTPAPITEAPPVEENEEPTQAQMAHVIVTPQTDGYAVKLTAEKTVKATVHLGGQTAELAPDTGTSTWSGSIEAPAGSIAPGGESLYVTVQTPDKPLEFQPVATIAPGSETPDIFGRAEKTPPQLKLFGFLTLKGLDDIVHRVYTFFILFLAASLLINILVKFHVQKATVLAHGSLVLVLGIILSAL
jgi:hypothetical protein